MSLNKINKLITYLEKSGNHAQAVSLKKKAEAIYLVQSGDMADMGDEKAEEEAEEEGEESDEEQAEEREEGGDLSCEAVTQKLFAMLQTNTVLTRTAHWSTKGKTYYGDHLLFERLYNDDAGEIDGFVEKFIPHVGEDFISPHELFKFVSGMSKEIMNYQAEMDPQSLVEAISHSEEELLKVVDEAYSTFEKAGRLTMGLDDFLMSMHNEHEDHLYLLGQRLKGE